MERESNKPYVNVPETIHRPPSRIEVETLIRKVADRILQETRYGFRVNGTEYEEVPGNNQIEAVKLLSGHTDWKYWNGVINIGMFRLGEELNNEKYIEHPYDFFRFAFDNLGFFKKLFDDRVPEAPFHQYFRMDRLDDCGALGAALIENIQRGENSEKYNQRIEETADYIHTKQDRLSDGTFVRKRFNRTTMWADDLYMSVPFLSRYYIYSENKKFLDDAIKQVKNFHKRLFSETTELYHHCWYAESDIHGVAHWGRANGWMAMAVCDLLDHMPSSHPEKDDIIRILLKQIIGFSRYQSKNGMWRQLLNKEDAWLESSVTAMFTYAVARAVNNGWIENIYASIAVNGWKGLSENISPGGELENVSTGFNIKQDLPFYYNIPVEKGGAHGLGAFLLAGSEMLKLKEYRDCLWC